MSEKITFSPEERQQIRLFQNSPVGRKISQRFIDREPNASPDMTMEQHALKAAEIRGFKYISRLWFELANEPKAE